MKEKIICVSMIIIVLGAIFIKVNSDIKKVEENKEVVSEVTESSDRYVTSGTIELPNGHKFSIDELNNLKDEDCKQVYYDKEEHEIVWAYSESLIK